MQLKNQLNISCDDFRVGTADRTVVTFFNTEHDLNLRGTFFVHSNYGNFSLLFFLIGTQKQGDIK